MNDILMFVFVRDWRVSIKGRMLCNGWYNITTSDRCKRYQRLKQRTWKSSFPARNYKRSCCYSTFFPVKEIFVLFVWIKFLLTSLLLIFRSIFGNNEKCFFMYQYFQFMRCPWRVMSSYFRYFDVSRFINFNFHF